MLRRHQFKFTRKEYLQEQFDGLLSKNVPSRDYKPRYWNFHRNDLFETLDAYENRLTCIKV